MEDVCKAFKEIVYSVMGEKEYLADFNFLEEKGISFPLHHSLKTYLPFRR